jgi:hypothetical protein
MARGKLIEDELTVGLVLHFGPEPKFYRQILTNDMKIKREKKHKPGFNTDWTD